MIDYIVTIYDGDIPILELPVKALNKDEAEYYGSKFAERDMTVIVRECGCDVLTDHLEQSVTITGPTAYPVYKDMINIPIGK